MLITSLIEQMYMTAWLEKAIITDHYCLYEELYTLQYIALCFALTQNVFSLGPV
jgi:hypothetical protein